MPKEPIVPQLHLFEVAEDRLIKHHGSLFDFCHQCTRDETVCPAVLHFKPRRIGSWSKHNSSAHLQPKKRNASGRWLCPEVRWSQRSTCTDITHGAMLAV